MKLYLETTVFNWYFENARPGHLDVVALFEAIRDGHFDGFTSEYVATELEAAPEPRRSDALGLLKDINMLPSLEDDKVLTLAGAYIDRGIIPARYIFDAAHIAFASLSGMDRLVSYNMQHINRHKTKHLIGGVNERFGLGALTICVAKEVIDDDIDRPRS